MNLVNYDFLKASRDVLDNKKLSDLTKQISEETSRRFADEIMNMKEDEKVLLLAFAYIRPINVDVVEEMFDSIVSELVVILLVSL